jgi:hypothetical protein
MPYCDHPHESTARVEGKGPFDVEKDLVGVDLINYSPLMIVGRKSLSANLAQSLPDG